MVVLNGYPNELFELVHDIVSVSDEEGFEEPADLEKRLWVVQFHPADRNLASLMDCWRQALLLYCARVCLILAQRIFLPLWKLWFN